MADNISSLDELLAAQRKEKKELTAKTQKMKHGVPKGDKKKKKEVTAEITQLLADLDLKHENELKEYETASPSTEGPNKSELAEGVDKQEEDSLIKEEVGQSVSLDRSDSQSVSLGKRDSHSVSLGSGDGQSVPLDRSDSQSVSFIRGDGDNKAKSTQKLSKAQKRRNKKAALLKERNEAIAAQEMENLTGSRHKESELINQKLSDRNLTVHEIPSDGDCLYRAVEHQLSYLNLKTMTVQDLREETSKHMLSHMEDYMPFLTCPETGDVLSEESYVKYCEDIAKTSAWGGHIEVQVLSHVCGLPVEVIQAEGPSVMAGDENSERKLILSYHRHVFGLGEHFNSVVKATE